MDIKLSILVRNYYVIIFYSNNIICLKKTVYSYGHSLKLNSNM